MLSFNFDTPLEEHLFGEKQFYVKRDDLLNGDLDLPPWAKMEGIKQVLLSDGYFTDAENKKGSWSIPKLTKDRPIIHLSISVSYSGWALAYIGRELGFDINQHTTNPPSFSVNEEDFLVCGFRSSFFVQATRCWQRWQTYVETVSSAQWMRL